MTTTTTTQHQVRWQRPGESWREASFEDLELARRFTREQEHSQPRGTIVKLVSVDGETQTLRSVVMVMGKERVAP